MYTTIIGPTFARCGRCLSDFSSSHGGRNDVTTHVNGNHHQEKRQAALSTRSITSFYNPEIMQRLIEAETRWAMFVAQHNIAFLTSDHLTRLFLKMFPDSEIGKILACGHTKTTAIVKTHMRHTFTKKHSKT